MNDNQKFKMCVPDETNDIYTKEYMRLAKTWISLYMLVNSYIRPEFSLSICRNNERLAQLNSDLTGWMSSLIQR